MRLEVSRRNARDDFRATLLDSGKLLICGGSGSYITSELYW
jgi:hypothetical protein